MTDAQKQPADAVGSSEGLGLAPKAGDYVLATIRGNGFRRVARIRKDVGRWLLTVAAPHLEKCPPGTVNLWTMLTESAFDVHSDTEA